MSSGARTPDPSRVLVPACFFFSGAAGLALEVVWSKYLSLLLGNSVHGVATVVAAFLGGLGIGAALSGRRAVSVRNPLAGYAALEAVVGALALISPFAYQLGRPIFAGLYEALGGTGPVFHLARFVLLFVTMLVPTIAMGATLPLIVEDASRRRPREASASVARLYAINTGGAVAGTVLAGFIAVPAWGLAKSAMAAGFLDLAIAATLFGMRVPSPAPATVDTDVAVAASSSKSQTTTDRAAPFAAWLLPAFALSGLAAILYQVAWTRLLTVPFGGITYAFSAILAIYLFGLALGAAAAHRALRRTRSPVVLFGVLQAALAGSVAGGLHALQRLPHWQTAAIAASEGSVPRLLAAESLIAAVLLLPPTLLLGALFPAAVAIRRGTGEDASRATGAVYSANTMGSIAGSLFTAYFLIPRFGAPAAILGAAALNAFLGTAALVGGEASARFRRVGAAAVVALAAAYAFVGMPSWSPERMSLGLIRLLRSYWYGGEALTHRVIDAIGNRPELGRILFYRDGPVASVAVLETAGQRTLLINGKADATTGEGSDMRTQVLVGHFPLLVAPGAKDVFVIGYGSGVTTGAALAHDVRQVRTVELEPAVVAAAPEFQEAAGDPLHDPRHVMQVEDASLVLRSENRAYDVIVSEPSNFWIAGMGNLFSEDFYRIAAQRLRPGGVLCQWVQCYQISPAAIHAVVRTLSRTFPHGQVFYIDSAADLIILASPRKEVPLDPAAWEEVSQRPTVARDLARVGVMTPADLLRYYRGRLDRIAKEVGDGPVNTDDNGWLEHRAPFDLLTDQSAEGAMPWSDAVAADLARSLTEAGGTSAGGARGLLDASATHAAAAGDSLSAAWLMRTASLLPTAPEAAPTARAGR